MISQKRDIGSREILSKIFHELIIKFNHRENQRWYKSLF